MSPKKKAKSKAPAKPKRKTIHLMFLYRHPGAKGEARNIFHVVEKLPNGRYHVPVDKDVDDEPAPFVLLRKAKTLRGSCLTNPMCGGVYIVECEGEGSVYPQTAKYESRHHDKKKISEWQALDHTNRDVIALAAAEKKEHDHDYVFEFLLPAQRTYKQMRGFQRTLFLARVVKFITGA